MRNVLSNLYSKITGKMMPLPPLPPTGMKALQTQGESPGGGGWADDWKGCQPAHQFFFCQVLALHSVIYLTLSDPFLILKIA